MRRLLLLLPLILTLSSCDEMTHQPRYQAAGRGRLFPDGKAMQAPPEGTVAQDDPARAAALDERPPMTLDLLKRGRQRYDIYCSPCHDVAGAGRGPVVARGFPAPPSLDDPRLVRAPSRYFVEVITQGHGVMYDHADRVTPTDRWAIAAYIRALQRSRSTPVDELNAADRAHLSGGTP
ncbi:mono/diheme cytochrome c family protein [Nitrospirillum amazonense]|uniref:Mono/diheme cytochrome c family protein n=1 Tax=Nitrospirillum amazonense TaxID=28077 RepID=A0A560ESU4_9PROT|nr:cytochrome c [Nitrospirillum amazonense]TWB12434.1 mono/diheme cytochrome c family protein [Nitrospirillum amazonense]